MADSTPVVGIIALIILIVTVLVILPVGSGRLVIPQNEDYEQRWEESQVHSPSVDFSAGFALLVLNLALMLGIISYSLLSYRDPDDEEPWRELSYYEDDE